MRSQEESADTVLQWMSFTLPQQTGTGVRRFLAANAQREFARIIYITAGPLVPEVDSLPPGEASPPCVCPTATGRG